MLSKADKIKLNTLSSVDKIKLYIFTFLIDIYFLFIYNLVKIYLYKVFIQLIFLTHILFYIGLYYNFRKLLDFIHYLIIIYPTITLFINDCWIKLNKFNCYYNNTTFMDF